MVKNILLGLIIIQSTSAIEELLKDNEHGIIKPLTAETLSFLSKKYKVSLVSVAVEYPRVYLDDIINKIRNKTLDVLLKLEKEFGNLDSMDIDINNSNVNINNKKDIINIIYNDKSITIGSNNTIKDSNYENASE